MNQEHTFQVNLRGVIDLLSGHLYSGPQVYIRELAQNAVDAIAARKLHQPDCEGQIEFHWIDGETPTLVVSDNGVGLNQEEVHQFLATIGMSSKRQNFDRETFIGQFGIGLLSAFMVSDEIVLITKSARHDTPAIKWTGRADGTYTVTELEETIQPGSQVYLRAKPGCRDFLEAEYIRNALQRFTRYLQTPIHFVTGSEKTVINGAAPWEAVDPQSGSLQAAQLPEDFDAERYLAVIPLSHPEGRYQGVACVLPSSAATASRQGDEVYLKGMLVSEKVENLLPDWAFFVRCIVNVKDLRPTASRESFHDDELLAETRSDLGTSLRQWLLETSKRDPGLLEELIAVHFLPLKALATEDPDFFELFCDWLPFETSLGRMTLGEIKQLGASLRFTRTRDHFRQISAVAAAQNLCLINGGYAYDAELIEQLANTRPELSIEEVNSSDIAHQFSNLTSDDERATQAFLELAGETLSGYRCQPIIREFQPATLAALYTTDSEADFLRSLENSRQESNPLFGDVLGDLEKQFLSSSQPQLCFNFSNPLVKRLISLQETKVVQQAIEMLYLQSLLLGHYPLKRKEMSLLNRGLSRLIDLAIRP